MKIYFTTDGSVDETLQQFCPFDEEHHFKRDDGSEFTMPKNVGCGGCAECKYCYGRGYSGYLGNGRPWMLVPIKFRSDGWDYDESADERQRKLGMEQFRIVSESSYIKCARCYEDSELRRFKKIWFKMWWWHHVGLRLQNVRYSLSTFYYKKKFKVEDFFRKCFQHKTEEV